MIGNDVVDIAAARLESNIWRKGWQEKLFNEEERKYIAGAKDTELAVWLLWSMKEAAYKAWNRETGIRTFNPHKLECSVILTVDGRTTGKVRIHDNIYYTRSTISGRVIHTIAAQTETMLYNIHEVPAESVLTESGELPYSTVGEVKVPASKSHHGKTKITVTLINI